MTKNQIEIFLSMTETLSFTKTAELFFVTQPTVSRQISMLEEEWGVCLFDRNRRSVKTSKAGEMLAEVCKASFAQIEETLQKARELQ